MAQARARQRAEPPNESSSIRYWIVVAMDEDRHPGKPTTGQRLGDPTQQMEQSQMGTLVDDPPHYRFGKMWIAGGAMVEQNPELRTGYIVSTSRNQYSTNNVSTADRLIDNTIQP